MTQRTDGIARRSEKADELAPQRDNPFNDMTLETAKADPFWDAITITKDDDGTLKIEVKMIAEIHLPSVVIAETKGDIPGQIALMFFQRLSATDLPEAEMFLKHKLAEHLNAA